MIHFAWVTNYNLFYLYVHVHDPSSLTAGDTWLLKDYHKSNHVQVTNHYKFGVKEFTFI